MNNIIVKIHTSLFIVICFTFSCVNSKSSEDENSTPSKSTYRHGDIPQFVIISQAIGSDTTEISETYPDTIIKLLFHSKDSTSKYFYNSALNKMKYGALDKAIGDFKQAIYFGYEKSICYSAIGNCYYQDALKSNFNVEVMYDSALWNINKALELNPNEGGAKIIKQRILNNTAK